MAEHAAECYALSKLQSIPLSHDTDFESARLALRCLARRAVEAPASDDLHFRDVEDLLTHRLATLRSSMLASVSTDAQLLIPLLPFPCADVGVKGLTELLLRIKFNAHPVRDSWERRTGQSSPHILASCIPSSFLTPHHFLVQSVFCEPSYFDRKRRLTQIFFTRSWAVPSG